MLQIVAVSKQSPEEGGQEGASTTRDPLAEPSLVF
jgi:hypothetical protein